MFLYHRENKVDGFTLLEVVIALTILSVALLGLAELQIVAIKGNKKARDLTSAVILAEKKIEELKNTGFDNLSAGTFDDANNPINEVGADGGIFNRSWEIDDYADSSNMKRVSVTIEWADANHSISLSTVLSEDVGE